MFRAMDASRLSVRIIAFAAFSALCYFGASVIITLLLAIIAAYMLDPIVGFLEKMLPRAFSILIVLLISTLLLSGLVYLLVERAQDFSDNLPKYRSRIVKVQRDIQTRIRNRTETFARYRLNNPSSNKKGTRADSNQRIFNLARITSFVILDRFMIRC